jgi:hypothetical protein
METTFSLHPETPTDIPLEYFDRMICALAASG